MAGSALTRAPSGAYPRRWWALAAIGLSQLMITLDTTIVTIALPSAQRGLSMSDVDRQWVVTAYTLTFGGLLLLGGRIADRVGRKRTLLVGVLGFAVASVVGGLATSGPMLVGARTGQGLFAALLAPSTLAMLNTIFTDQVERARAIGIYTVALIGGGAMGLVGGGLITSSLGWRWCMYVNVPIALLAAVGALATLPDPPGHSDATVSGLSAVTGCGGIVAVVYGCTEAGRRGWHAGPVWFWLAAAAVLLVVFVLLQRRVRGPLLPLRILADRNRGTAFGTVALVSIALFGVFLFLTYELQVVLGYSAVRTGVALVPLVVANVLGAILVAGRLMPKIAPRLLIAPALLCAVAGLGLLTQLTPDSSYVAVILPAELLIGLGIGSSFGPCVSVATAGVDPGDAGVASATVSAAQQVGASIGVALLNTIAATATVAFVTSHPSASTAAASVHGYAVAATWAAAILLGTAVLVTVFINAGPARTASPGAVPRPEKFEAGELEAGVLEAEPRVTSGPVAGFGTAVVQGGRADRTESDP